MPFSWRCDLATYRGVLCRHLSAGEHGASSMGFAVCPTAQATEPPQVLLPSLQNENYLMSICNVLKGRAAQGSEKQLCETLKSFIWKTELNLSSYTPSFKKAFFWPRFNHTALPFSWHQSVPDAGGGPGNIYCPIYPSKLTERPSFTITCHPNKLEGGDTSHLNQLVAVSE